MSNRIFRYGGFAEEDSYGVLIPVDFHSDITGASLDVPDDPNLYYAGGTGRARRIVRPGYYSPSGNIVQGVDVDSIGWFLRWALGGYEYSVDTHKIWGAIEDTELPSFSAYIGKDLYEHAFAGCVINSLQMQVDDSFAQVTLDINAQKDSKAVIKSFDDLSITAEPILAFHELTATAGITTALIRSLEINISNGVDAAAGRSAGSRYPRRMNAGERIVTASLSLWFEDTTQRELFWGAASGPSDDGATQTAMTFKLDGGTDKEIQIELPACVVSANPHQPGERNRLEESITLQAVVGTSGTIDSDIIFSVKNNIADIGELSA